MRFVAPHLADNYDPLLVALSVVIAVLTSGAALDLAGRVTVAEGRARLVWLLGGAFVMGFGIWSMHYTGMLAFRLPVPVLYHVPTVALSLAAAILASFMCLFVASRERLNPGRAAVGSMVMGAGIAIMHYTGMMAMRLPASMEWDPWLVLLSIAIAVAVSAVALWLAFHHGHDGAAHWGWRKVGAALLMGAAIPGMHYTGMTAATFVAVAQPPDTTQTMSITTLGAGAIGAGALLALSVAFVSAFLDRRLSAMHAAIREGRDLLHGVVEGSGEAIFAKDIQGRYLMANSATATLVSRTTAQVIGLTDAEIFPEALARRIREVDCGIIVDGITRVREETFDHPDGQRTRLVSQGPLRDSTGRIIGVVGAAQDITDRKRAEAEQARLVVALQAALAEVRTLRGLVTVCATCRRVLTDAGSWQQLEAYVRQHTEADFSHGLCPDCAQKWEKTGF